jgi:hypothetical protein
MMKIIIKNTFFALLVSFSLISCEDLEVINENQPDAVEALGNPSDVSALLDGAGTSLMLRTIGFSGMFYNLMADQTSTTNAYQGFWNFADQPRLQINNSPTNANLGASVGGDWSGFNNAIFSANLVIDLIEFKSASMVIEGVDYAPQMLAQAYFIKGLSQGFLGMIYDKAYIVNPDSDLTNLEFKDYNTVSSTAVENIEKSISLASAVSGFEYFIYQGYNLNKADFIEVANSFAAKILISTPRTKAEAATVDYAKVLAFANKGISKDFSPPTNGGYEFYNNMQDWSTYTLSSGAGYLPTDIKVLSLLDPTYPKDYPLDANVILDPATSNDPRLSYFKYAVDFGYLRESRGRALFTNYKNERFYTDNDRGTLPGLSTDIFHTEELNYIKAEAKLRTAGAASGATVLNSSARFSKGNITTPSTEADIEYALHYEYSVELDLAATVGTQWMFMRRFDLLQKGTPLSYPVPGTELEITGSTNYSFGGEADAGKEGTASGANSWKD